MEKCSFSFGAFQCIAQSSLTLQQPRNEPWGEGVFFYVNGCFQGEARKSISTLKMRSPSERSEENVTVNKFRLLKKKMCDAIKSEIFPGAEIMPTNCSTKNWNTFVSKCCTKATGLAWASLQFSASWRLNVSKKLKPLPSYSTQIDPDLTSQTQICSVYNDVKQIKRWKSSHLRNYNQPMVGKLAWSTFHRLIV